MQCKDCDCCKKGFFSYMPDDYVCIGVKEPFLIDDINMKCTAYSDEYWRHIKNGKTEILLKDALALYDKEEEKMFYEPDDFVDYYWDKYLYGKEYKTMGFDEFYEDYIPHILWNCYKEELHINASRIVEEACEDLHEDAFDSIDYRDLKELQKYLDKWCKEQTCTVTYYPSDKEYVTVEREWFG